MASCLYPCLQGVPFPEPFMSRLADPEKKKALCARLARTQGQLRGLQKFMQEVSDGD
jgi:hypothetical protein